VAGSVSEEDSTYGQIKVALNATDMTANHIDGYVIDDTADCIAATFNIDTIPAERGLAGTALPAAAADAAGGLPISDAGGLDMDTYIKRLEAAWTAALAARLDENVSAAKTLTVAYDAAKTAATQTSVDTIDNFLDTEFPLLMKWWLNKLVRTDNGDGTITYVLYDDDNATPLKTWVYTTATGARARAS
jgi:hypothetical protein